MLSPTERDRLKNRDSEDMDSQIRASNDARVKRKLTKWLNEDLDDVYLIIEKLREDQLKKIFTDDNVYQLLEIIGLIIAVRDFRTLVGELEHPEDWKVIKHPEDCIVVDSEVLQKMVLESGHPENWKEKATVLGSASDLMRSGSDLVRPATDMDINRMALLVYSLKGLEALNVLGSGNPVASALSYIPLLADPKLKDRIRVTEEEMRGIARVYAALNTETE